MEPSSLTPEQTKRIKKAKLILWLGLGGIVLIGLIIIFYFVFANKAVAPTVNGNVNTATNINIATNTNSTVSTSDWKTYENKEYGFSIKVPKEIVSNYGSCKWNEEKQQYREGNDHSYRPVNALVPTKIFEDNNIVYISTEYYHELTGKTEEIDGISHYYYFSGCEKVDNSLSLLEDNQNHYEQDWKFIVTTVQGDTDIENAIKDRYGVGCSIGQKIESNLQEGVYDVVIQGDGKDLQESECPVNYMYKIKYYPRKNLLVSWDLGQAPTFWQTLNPPKDYDQEMVDSFIFL